MRDLGCRKVYQQDLKRCEDSDKGLKRLSKQYVNNVVSLHQMKMNVSKTMVAAVKSV